jgi:hypothetical protein
MTSDDYVTFVGNPCSQEPLLVCQLCGQQVRHDNPTMRNHFENGHKISLSDYFSRFVDDENQESCNTSAALKWASGCTYQCQFDNSKFRTQQDFRTHLEEKHKNIVSELEPFTSTIFACNNICAFARHKDPSIVSKYVGDAHNMNLESILPNFFLHKTKIFSVFCYYAWPF